MIRTRRIATLFALAVALAALSSTRALAHDPDEQHEPRRAPTEELKEPPKKEKAPEPRKEQKQQLKAEWKKKHEAWKAKRKERADERRAELVTRWGAILDKPAAREELRVHARRAARLSRVLFLAEANDKPKLADRAKALIEKERARHQKRMEALKAEHP